MCQVPGAADPEQFPLLWVLQLVAKSARKAWSPEKYRLDELPRLLEQQAATAGGGAAEHVEVPPGFALILPYYVKDRYAIEMEIARRLFKVLSGLPADNVLAGYAAFWIFRMLTNVVIVSADHPLFDEEVIGTGSPQGKRLRKLLRLEPVQGSRDTA